MIKSFLFKLKNFFLINLLKIIYLFTDKVLYRCCSIHYAIFFNCNHCKSLYWARPYKDEVLSYTKDGTYSYCSHLGYDKMKLK